MNLRGASSLPRTPPFASSPPSLHSLSLRPTMPAFLVDPAHADVQQVILDRLAEPSIHELLPLLRVCRYLRQLVIQRVVALFSRPGTPYGRQYIGRALKPRPGDGFIKVRSALAVPSSSRPDS